MVVPTILLGHEFQMKMDTQTQWFIWNCSTLYMSQVTDSLQQFDKSQDASK